MVLSGLLSSGSRTPTRGAPTAARGLPPFGFAVGLASNSPASRRGRDKRGFHRWAGPRSTSTCTSMSICLLILHAQSLLRLIRKLIIRKLRIADFYFSVDLGIPPLINQGSPWVLSQTLWNPVDWPQSPHLLHPRGPQLGSEMASVRQTYRVEPWVGPSESPDSYTQSPLQDSRLFGPRPWKILATTYKQIGSWATQTLAKILWWRILWWRPGVVSSQIIYIYMYN